MPVRIEQALPMDLPVCAEIACDSEIGLRYEFRKELLLKKMEEGVERGHLILVAVEEVGPSAPVPTAPPFGTRSVVGFAWIDFKGGFGQAPYLKLIVIDTRKRKGGVGSLLLSAFEERTKGMGRAWFLLVSDFNVLAQRFYEKHGYVCAGRLPHFARTGITELIMYKVQPDDGQPIHS